MKPEIKKRWVDALRSGKYKQGKERLKRRGELPKYCCLGVLCDLAVQDGVCEWKDEYDDDLGVACCTPTDESTSTIPVEVQYWSGLKARYPELNGVPMAVLNDSRGLTFDDIADLIEEHL